MGMLNELGLVGWDEIEDFLLASLLTGDGLLLVGPRGAAKTYCASRVAEGLGVRFQKLDASKAEFEDYLGFPNPKALAEGRFECVTTPTSIQDKEFLFVDEINRAKPQTQNKLLEVVYSRQVMGLPIKAKWVWGAMNLGDEYAGLEPLDAAFAGRFAWVIPVPEADGMGEESLKSVILSEGPEDAAALKRHWRADGGGGAARGGASRLHEVLARAASFYPETEKLANGALGAMIACLAKILGAAAKLKLDGRRLSMLRRNVLSLLSVRRALGHQDAIPEDLYWAVKRVLPYSLDGAALGKPLDPLNLTVVFDELRETLRGSDALYRIVCETNLVQRMKLAASAELGLSEKSRLMSDVLDEAPPFERYLLICALLPIALKRGSLLPLPFRMSLIERWKSQKIKGRDLKIKDAASLDQFSGWLKVHKSRKPVMQIAWSAACAFAPTDDERALRGYFGQGLRFLRACRKTLRGFYEAAAVADAPVGES